MQRLSLSNTAFEGNNNVYLLSDGPETVLIDTGDGTDHTRQQLESGLGEHGVDVADVDRVFLTHWHGDHSGLAGHIQRESGAEVYVHPRDAPLVEGDDDAWAAMNDMQFSYFEEWGIPENKQRELSDVMTSTSATDPTPTVSTFEDGDTFTVNDRELTVVHTSGHADGLCMFEFDAGGRPEVFSGDALLPQYTPNVGGADVRVERPLEKYITALRNVVAADYDRAWPGHRDPIDDPAGRAEYIVHHHEERAWRVLDTLARLGPCDAWTVSAELFGELQSIHILHGPGESYAHLEHLERNGVVERDGRHYRIGEGYERQVYDREDERWPLDV